VLINRNHSYTDLYLPIDARQLRLLEAIDGDRTIAEISHGRADPDVARAFFRQLWRWDQVVFDTSGAQASKASDAWVTVRHVVEPVKD
jgi:hypothetical protein